MFRLAVVLLALQSSLAFAQLPPDQALATMTAGDGLQVELFAAEPMLINPTAIDVDHKGRVWVAEAVNYRRKNFNRPILRKEGDRIQILIDTNGDGKADEAKTFYQGEDLYGPLSVLVLPQADGKALRVLVAQSPDILEFWDRDGDLKADGPPTKWLSGFGGFDHDHGVHGLTVGPDGKLYFTVGDSGVKDLKSKDGKGKSWTSNTTDVQKGTVWRCDLDGNNLELIAHNFRNNYEACVDSFGEIWLSDNDDDGNQQTRICFVMPGGNYGYGPRGAGQTHWHEEQPGIVHKTLRTGFGSPTGICFYEGTLLPKQYQGDLIHCDAGPREVRYFKRKPKGAGYELDKIDMLTSSDGWFRPSDCCVAPDGSVFVSDWYDPGVGGHGMGDHTRGRIYRLTPSGHKGYTVPEVKLETKEGVLGSLLSPNQAVRYMALQTTYRYTKDQLGGLFEPFEGKPTKTFLEARVNWLGLLTVVGKNPTPNLLGFIDDGDSTLNMRWFGEHMAVQNEFSLSGSEVAAQVLKAKLRLRHDRSETTLAYRRELLLLIRNAILEEAVVLFPELAKLYDGQDHFYRAALNIACGTDPARRDAILADFEKHFPEWNDKVADLVWELRPKSMLPKMEKLLGDAKLTAAQKARIVDILAASDDVAAGKTMLTLLKGDHPADVKARAIENLRLFLPTKWNSLAKGEELKQVIETLLKENATAATGLQLVAAAKYLPAVAVVCEIANSPSRPQDLRGEAIRTLAVLPDPKAIETLKGLLVERRDVTAAMAEDAIRSLAAQMGLGQANGATAKLARDVLEGLVLDNRQAESLRRAAVVALSGTRTGTLWLIAIKERGGLPKEFDAETGRLLRNSPFQGERNKAMILFPAPGKLDPKKLPPIRELIKRTGNAANGQQVLAKSLTSEVQCLKCHMVRGQGGQIGPDLSMIGKKASKENLYDSLLTPSKAIADQYLSWKLDSDDGQSITGLLVGETETTLTIRDANGKDFQFPVKGTSRSKSLQSIMPDGLVATLTEDELVDLVEYLTKLQTPSWTPDYWHLAGPFAAEGDSILNLSWEPDNKPFDLNTKFNTKVGPEGWKRAAPNANGYVDLAAFHGPNATQSASYLIRSVESPTDQDATILLGTDDGCRLVVNGEKVFGHERHEAAKPERDSVPVKLKKGVNTIVLKINNGSNPHGFYLSVVSSHELKAIK